MRMFALFVGMTAACTAGLIVTADPSTSPTYPAGSNFDGEVSATTNPIGPFSSIAVQFQGWQVGGSQVSLDGNPCSFSDACLVFLYDLNFSTPTAINSISFSGDAFNGATFELLSSSDAVIDSLSVSSGNVGSPVTYTMNTPGASGTTFHLALYDTSSDWTFVDNISINTAPEPATYSTVLASLALIAWTQRRLRVNSKKRAPGSGL
jgi:hypothetical protein